MTTPTEQPIDTRLIGGSVSDLVSSLGCALANGDGPARLPEWEALHKIALDRGEKSKAVALQRAINKVKSPRSHGEHGGESSPSASSVPSVSPAERVVQMIPLSRIFADHSLQIRCENDADQIDNIIEAMAAGADIPPIDLFAKDSFADSSYLIGDGWHRYYAAMESKRKEILAIIHPGGRPAALKHALGANAAHGLRRTSKDKRNAVTLALTEFPKLSDRAISDLCKVDHKTVAAVRKQLGNFPSSRLGADGKERQLPNGKPVQMTLFDRLNEQFKPIADRIDIVCKAPWWIDKEIPHAEKMEAATSLENRLKGDLQRVQDLKKNLLKSEQSS